jgi:hypothetical protein
MHGGGSMAARICTIGFYPKRKSEELKGRGNWKLEIGNLEIGCNGEIITSYYEAGRTQ